MTPNSKKDTPMTALHTEMQKITQLEISNIVDALTNGLTHPLTAKFDLYKVFTAVEGVSAGRWVKASERLPDTNERYCVKVSEPSTPDYTAKMIIEFFNGQWVIYSEEFDEICINEWLDETTLPKLDAADIERMGEAFADDNYEYIKNIIEYNTARDLIKGFIAGYNAVQK